MALILGGASLILGLFSDLKALIVGKNSSSSDYLEVDGKTVSI